MHVARADLQDGDAVELVGRLENFADGGEAVSGGGVDQHAHARRAEALEGIGAGARLVRPAAEHRAARLGDCGGRLRHLHRVLDRAGARHDHERASAEGEAGADLDPRALGLSLAAHQAGSGHAGPLAPFTYESVASELSECFESCVV